VVRSDQALQNTVVAARSEPEYVVAIRPRVGWLGPGVGDVELTYRRYHVIIG